MAVYTPKGLKIRFDVPSAFSLMARLSPKYDARHVLRLTESVDMITDALILIVAVVCFSYDIGFWNTIIVVTTIRIVGSLLILFGVNLPGLVTIGKLYSNIINWFILPWVIPFALAYFLVGWSAVLAYVLVLIFGVFVEFIIGYIYGRLTLDKIGFAMTRSERAFIFAYQILAFKVGASLSIAGDDSEMEEDYWIDTFNEYAENYPNVAANCA